MKNNNIAKGSIRKKGKKYEGSFYNSLIKKHEYIREDTEELCKMTLDQMIYYTFKNDIDMVEKTRTDNKERNTKKIINTRENIANKKFEEVFEYWLTEVNTASKKTKDDYRGILKNHLTALNKQIFKKVTDFDIQKIYNTLREENGETFLYRLHKCLSAFYNAMYKKRISLINYMIFIDSPKSPKVKHVLFKDVEYDNIMNLLRCNTDPKTYYLYGLTILTGGMGLRIGEALGFTFPFLFLEDDFIKVENQITFEKGKGYYLSNKLKTPTSHRNVVFIPQIKEELITYLAMRQKMAIKLKQINKNINVSNFIIINEYGNFVPTNTAERHWREFKTKNNINTNVRIHDLRRYFAKFLLKSNIPDIIAKKALGHTNINMTEYYQDDDDIDISKQFITNIKKTMESPMEF